MRTRSRLCTILVALVAGVGLAACGGGGEGGTSSPASKDQAIERCREEAAKLSGDARNVAEAACETAETGDTTKAKDASRELCLNATQEIRDPAAKRQAQEQCKSSTQ